MPEETYTVYLDNESRVRDVKGPDMIVCEHVWDFVDLLFEDESTITIKVVKTNPP